MEEEVENGQKMTELEQEDEASGDEETREFIADFDESDEEDADIEVSVLIYFLK
jgi:hypothetical protein